MVKVIRNVLLLSLASILASCSKQNDFDEIISAYWNKCKKERCIIDLEDNTEFDWDVMYYFSGANSLEDIEKKLGFQYKNFTDIGDKLIFIKDQQIVRDFEWFSNPSEPVKGAVFEIDSKFLKVCKKDAKFSIEKINQAYYLKKL